MAGRYYIIHSDVPHSSDSEDYARAGEMGFLLDSPYDRDKNNLRLTLLDRRTETSVCCPRKYATGLVDEDALLLQAVSRLNVRIEIFSKKLSEYRAIAERQAVFVTDQSDCHRELEAVVRYKGPLGDLPGKYFGVELLVRLSLTAAIVSACGRV